MPPIPLPTSFSAATDPWIEVRTGFRHDRVGLLDLFLRAHTFDDLALPHPPAASALLRIAVAITARITGLDDPELGASEWNRLRRSCLDAGRFDPDQVHTYFAQHQWNVFDPVRPWLQDPALRAHCDDSTGINTLVTGRPAGNNFAWFSPHHDLRAEPVPTAEALQHLLIHHFYGRSGTGTPRTADVISSKQLSSGPLRATVSFHPLGRTLHETLLAGCPSFTGDEQLSDDHCPWELPKPADPFDPPHPVTWPGRLLTGRSRHAILLIPGNDGATVTDAYLTWAVPSRQPRLETTDPYLAYTIDPTKPVERRRSTRRADADRAWWRELDTLLLAPDENSTTRRPDIFSTLNDLPPDLRRTLRIRVHGFDQDGKTIDHQWYTALTPPLLHWTQEHDPHAAQRIADCCRAAEEVAKRLTTVTRQAWQATTSPAAKPRSKRTGRDPAWTDDAATRYWPLAEAVFWRLLDQPDTPAPAAFTEAAATALRTTTRTARQRSTAAARAVAIAVRDLRRQSAPHRKSST
ncbi:type I-E CRISPR-associated protein Cse1/CasA [Streptomyces sp. NPDC020965]|uniref:type I-E CRISPR-associated protein Cse1/CasA n=1 Tax=Streptomyces sp. NPDC020965 TaxID=3365105 RepID=UPI0037A63771